MKYIVTIKDSSYVIDAKSYKDALRLVKRVHDDNEEEKKRKAQEWIDYDIKHYGKVSETTKKLIKEAGLDFDKWDNQVDDSKKNSNVKDAAFDRSTLEALISDEKAAIDSYNVAIANLDGKISDEGIKVLQAIRDDEERHTENLYSILSGNITEKNLTDSTLKDDANNQDFDEITRIASKIAYKANKEEYQTVANLCYNLIQYLKSHKLAK